MLPAEIIGPGFTGERAAKEIAATDGVGEEAPPSDLVAASSKRRRLLAPGGALVLATGSWVLGGHRGSRGRWGWLMAAAERVARLGLSSNECEKEEGRSWGSLKRARELHWAREPLAVVGADAGGGVVVSEGR